MCLHGTRLKDKSTKRKWRIMGMSTKNKSENQNSAECDRRRERKAWDIPFLFNCSNFFNFSIWHLIDIFEIYSNPPCQRILGILAIKRWQKQRNKIKQKKDRKKKERPSKENRGRRIVETNLIYKHIDWRSQATAHKCVPQSNQRPVTISTSLAIHHKDSDFLPLKSDVFSLL